VFSVSTTATTTGPRSPRCSAGTVSSHLHWTAGPSPRRPRLTAAVRDWWAALLQRCIGHHLWATERLLEHCRALSPEQLALSASGTYGSIGATLDHLLSSDRFLLSSLSGGGQLPPWEAGGPGPLLEHLVRQREGWSAYLASGPDFEAPIRRRGVDAPAWVTVVQAIYHGNDHRTHAGTVLLSHELEAPDIDVWSYAWAEGMLQPLP